MKTWHKRSLLVAIVLLITVGASYGGYTYGRTVEHRKGLAIQESLNERIKNMENSYRELQSRNADLFMENINLKNTNRYLESQQNTSINCTSSMIFDITYTNCY